MTAAEEKRNVYDLIRAELDFAVREADGRERHAEALWAALYRHRARSWDEVALPESVRQALACRFRWSIPGVAADQRSSDGFTRKFLLGLNDGETVESVLMRFTGRVTACVSSQAGCAMGCVFCATGQQGFKRHLSAGEIVTQVLHIERELAGAGEALRNVVLMGMGEPLHNYDAVMAAVEILCDQKGIALAARRITLSTVGVVPGIIRLADERRALSLAVSLHGATDAERSALVPVGRRWPLSELMGACRYYCAALKRKIFFEWTLIAGRNDSVDQARQLGDLLAGLPAHVNLIPLNLTSGYAGSPTEAPRARAFQAALAERGIPSTVRQRRGIDIAAGCGQLAGETASANTP